MKRKIYTALASCIVVVFALVFVEPAGASAYHDGHHVQNHKQNHKQETRRARHRARAKKKRGRRAVSYVCPMHPDIREKSRITCPKCLMDLVAEPYKAKKGSGAARNPRG